MSKSQSPVVDRTLVLANYTKLSENIRRLTPQGIQCSVFCGGANCKYENPENWSPDSLAIQGIYSNWITDDILAMARPSTGVIIKKNIIQQFQSLGIKSIINLQCPKEHASCGDPLDNSGFSYDPSVFMENNIYYYNFCWRDYGDATLTELLNMIKVLAFAITEGRVAIHCHAGLGRTGVLIACFLVYLLRVSANDAIKYVRLRRPGSVQTRGQIVCVRHFAQFILPHTIIYYIKESKDKYMNDFTLQRFLKRQKIILHGYDERNFKYLPKIVHVICERILQLCGCSTDEFLPCTTSITKDFLYTKLNENIQRHESMYSISDTPSSPDSIKIPLSSNSYACSSLSVSPSPSECEDPTDVSQLNDSCSDLSIVNTDETLEVMTDLLSENKCFQELQTQKRYTEDDNKPKEIYDVKNVTISFLADVANFDSASNQTLQDFKHEINISQLGWSRLKAETNLNILSTLLLDWLENLKAPILGKENLEVIVIHYAQPENCLKKIISEDAYTIEYLLNFLAKLFPMTREDQEIVLLRMIASLTQQTVIINNKTFPSGRGFQKLREGTFNCTIKFFKLLLPAIYSHHRQIQISNQNFDEDHKRQFEEFED